MVFEWSEKKNSANRQKHGVSFEEAREVFDDPLAFSWVDQRFGYFEERWITIGATHKAHILVVANLFFNDRGEEIIRIISARHATKREKERYEKCT